MFNLGQWESLLAEPNMFAWYHLPRDQKIELVHWKPSDTDMEAFTDVQWRRVRRQIIDYAVESVRDYNNSYHNLSHFLAVEQSGLAILGAYEELTGRRLPKAVHQALAAALLLHDCHHCGDTFRADTRKPLYRPELGKKVSLEWVSGLAANDVCRTLGFCAPARLFQTEIIWATTYGGNTPRGRELEIPIVQPVSFWGWLPRAADIALPGRDLGQSMGRSIDVHFGNKNAMPRPTTWQGLVKSQLAFLDHVEWTYDQLDRVSGVAITSRLGWRAHLASLRVDTLRLYDRASGSQHVRIVEAHLRRYGAILP